jgi:hypothetical protein
VIIENGGYGKHAAAPIASLLVEKYLRDTISTDRLELEDEMTARNLMPNYLVRKQFKADSGRAADWARENGDSSRWIKYQTPSFRSMMLDTSYGSKSPLYVSLHKVAPYKSALAERLAKLRDRAAAEQTAADAANQSADSNSKAAPFPHADSIKRVRPPRPPVKKDSSGSTDSSGKASGADKPHPKDSTR